MCLDTEEIEAITIIDTLRRASCSVTVASVSGKKTVTMSRKTVVLADVLIQEVMEMAEKEPFDLIALPGGMPGATRLYESNDLQQLLQEQKTSNRLYAAPCVVFDQLGLSEGMELTCHPAFKNKLQRSKRTFTVYSLIHVFDANLLWS